MKRVTLALLIAVFGASLFRLDDAHAIGLKVAPLEYRTTLAAGEKKKGFVDVSNPGTTTLRVKSSVQGFRQTDDKGSLQFFGDEHLRTGIKLDLDEFDLGPKEAVRMYFLIDGAALPSGDVYGAIFFTTAPTDSRAGVGQSIRLGTLLSVVNGTPGARDAEVTKLSVSPLQWGPTVSGSYQIKNTAAPGTATGFYPNVHTGAAPFGEAKSQTGKLVFAGRTRTNEFSLKTPPLGLYRVGVSYQGKAQYRWVFVISPLGMLILALAAGISYGIFWRRRHARSTPRTGRA